MINSKAFKKLAALTAAIALVGSFAVSASAANVTTSTAYVSGDETKIEVNVKVTDVTAGSYVTYYASNDSGVFHMDQETATEANAVDFTQYVTEVGNLNAAVIVNDGNVAKPEDVTANTITINDEVEAVLPTEETEYTVTVTYDAGEGFTVDTDNVDVDGASAVVTQGSTATEWIVALSDIEGDVTVDFNVESTIVEPEAQGWWIASGFASENQDGKRQITVIGKVENLGDGVCGALVDDVKYESHTFAAESGEHANYFVVQLVDETAGDFISVGEHTTGIYYNDTEVAGSPVIAQ